MTTRRPVAVVTGASRGAGRGIARALGAAGWRVYLTGRTVGPDDAAAVTAAGGEGIAVRVDHAEDASVAALFERVHADGAGLQPVGEQRRRHRRRVDRPGAVLGEATRTGRTDRRGPAIGLCGVVVRRPLAASRRIAG